MPRSLTHLRRTESIPNGRLGKINRPRDNLDIARRSNEEISKISSDAYWTRAESQLRISTLRSDATRGVRNAIDPFTNAPIKIDNRYIRTTGWRPTERSRDPTSALNQPKALAGSSWGRDSHRSERRPTLCGSLASARPP